MNSYYKKSIIVFGLALPLLCMVAIIGASLYMVSSTEKKFKAKSVEYAKAKAEERKIAQLQKVVGATGHHVKKWQHMLDTETRGTFDEHWKTAGKNFTDQEFTRAPHNWVNYSEGLGKGISQPASQVEMKFTGTYRAMQLALMEVESKLPQLQLDSLVMAPDSGAKKINFTTKFTVWTKN